MLKKYTLFWRTGTTQVITGEDVRDAFTRAGVGLGAMAALDFWGSGDIRDEYEWDAKEREWKEVE